MLLDSDGAIHLTCTTPSKMASTTHSSTSSSAICKAGAMVATVNILLVASAAKVAKAEIFNFRSIEATEMSFAFKTASLLALLKYPSSNQ